MKVQVETLGLPTLSRLIGKKCEIEFDGRTVADLVAHIVARHGEPARKALLDQSGRLDMVIQVMRNDEGFVPREDYERLELEDGDRLKLMLLVGGG